MVFIVAKYNTDLVSLILITALIYFIIEVTGVIDYTI